MKLTTANGEVILPIVANHANLTTPTMVAELAEDSAGAVVVVDRATLVLHQDVAGHCSEFLHPSMVIDTAKVATIVMDQIADATKAIMAVVGIQAEVTAAVLQMVNQGGFKVRPWRDADNLAAKE